MPKKKMGRPQVEINQHDFESLCGLHCTLTDIAGFFECSEDTIERWCKRTYKDDDGNEMTFADCYKRFSAKGNASLRRTQFRLAERNAAMAIFLGKQYLGQKDQPEIVVGTGSLADAIQEAYEMHADEDEGDDSQ